MFSPSSQHHQEKFLCIFSVIWTRLHTLIDGVPIHSGSNFMFSCLMKRGGFWNIISMWHGDGNSISNGAIIATPRLLFTIFKNIWEVYIFKYTSMMTTCSVEKPDDSSFDFVDWWLFDCIPIVILLGSFPFGIHFSGNVFDGIDMVIHIYPQLLDLHDASCSTGKAKSQRSWSAYHGTASMISSHSSSGTGFNGMSSIWDAIWGTFIVLIHFTVTGSNKSWGV